MPYIRKESQDLHGSGNQRARPTRGGLSRV
jgi:hypothetical protein